MLATVDRCPNDGVTEVEVEEGECTFWPTRNQNHSRWYIKPERALPFSDFKSHMLRPERALSLSGFRLAIIIPSKST